LNDIALEIGNVNAAVVAGKCNPFFIDDAGRIYSFTFKQAVVVCKRKCCCIYENRRSATDKSFFEKRKINKVK